MPVTYLQILTIFLLILLNGVFATAEIALVSARKVRLEQAVRDGSKGAEAALGLMQNPNRFLSTVQVGISLIGVFSGALGGATLSEDFAVTLARNPRLAPYSEPIALIVVSLGITYFSLVLGELIPKRVALSNPERLASTLAPLMRLMSALTRPVISLLSASTEAGLRLLGVRPSDEPPVTEEEVRVMMRQGTTVGVFEETQQDIVDGVFRLGDRTIDAIMTSRMEVDWLDLEKSYAENLQVVLESSHSFFPVGAGSLDNIQGVVSGKELLRAALRQETADLINLMAPPYFVPESMAALKALEGLRSSGSAAAIVIDEYGGVLGMATLVDVLRSLIGEMGSSSEEPGRNAVQRSDGSWLVDGLLPVDVMKDLLGLRELPDEDRVGYQTVGGLILSQMGTIPEAGQYFEWGGLRFEVMDMDARRIDKVLIFPHPAEPEDDSAPQVVA